MIKMISYQKHGFKEYGEMCGNEIVAVYEL